MTGAIVILSAGIVTSLIVLAVMDWKRNKKERGMSKIKRMYPIGSQVVVINSPGEGEVIHYMVKGDTCDVIGYTDSDTLFVMSTLQDGMKQSVSLCDIKKVK